MVFALLLKEYNIPGQAGSLTLSWTLTSMWRADLVPSLLPAYWVSMTPESVSATLSLALVSQSKPAPNCVFKFCTLIPPKPVEVQRVVLKTLDVSNHALSSCHPPLGQWSVHYLPFQPQKHHMWFPSDSKASTTSSSAGCQTI